MFWTRLFALMCFTVAIRMDLGSRLTAQTMVCCSHQICMSPVNAGHNQFALLTRRHIVSQQFAISRGPCFAIVSLCLHSIGHCILHTSSLSHGFSTSFVRVHSSHNLSLALSRCCERKLLLTCYLTLHYGYKPPFTFYLKIAKVVCTWNTTTALVIL